MNSDLATHRAIRGASVACLAVSLLVFGFRVHAVGRAAASPPGVAVTSGFEEESWFAMWRFAHGQPVFADPTRLPFAGTYFNWLFYGAYGGIARPAVAIAGDAAIPSAGRLLSGILALGAIGVFLWAFRTLGDGLVTTAFAAFALLGPLVSWWALTVRPDIGALTFEALGVALVLRAMTDSRRAWFAAAGVAFFVAWSFKQSFVFSLVAAVGCLLVRRAWRDALRLGGVFAALAGAVLILGGTNYRSGIAHTAAVNDFYLAHGLNNVSDLLAKTAPLWILPAVLLLRWRSLGRTAHSLSPAGSQLCWIGLATTAALGTTLSCKLGASTNYFFSALPFLVGLNVLGFGAVRSPVLKLSPFALALALQLLALTGLAGHVTLARQSAEVARLWSEWRAYPQPRFASLTIFNLPWISPDSPPLVLAYNYPLQRQAGVEFEHGGVGGMISRGELAALLLPENEAACFDGATLEHYVAEKRLFGFVFLRRKDSP